MSLTPEAAPPRISVVMAVHNGERYLREAVESVLTQSFTDFELLIIDDGSTDGTRAIIGSYGDPRIRLLVNDRNLGLASSLNRGLREARGEFIARQDADDLSEPERFERQVAYLDAHPEVVLLGTRATLIDSEGRPGEKLELPTGSHDLRWALFFYCPFVHSSVMLRRAPVLGEVGLYDESLSYSEDYDLWCRIVEHYPIANLDLYLVHYRTHSGTMTATDPHAAAKFSQLRRTRIAARLGWRIDDASGYEERRGAMTALCLGWEVQAPPATLWQAAEDLLELHRAFTTEAGLGPAEIRAREAALRARISANLVMLGRLSSQPELSAGRTLLARAFALHPRAFLRPKTLARGAGLLAAGYLAGRRSSTGVAS